jgi:acyl carrier protein
MEYTMGNGITASAIADLIALEVTRIRPQLATEDLPLQASLTQDIGLDSLDLEQLFAFIKTHVVDVDLTPWLLSAARKGSDSLASLADFLASAQQQRAA